MKKKIIAFVLCISATLLSGCGELQSYEDFEMQISEKSTLTPTDNCYVESSYENRPSVKEPTLEKFISDDGLCIIEKKEDYFEVTLDYEKGDYKAVGSAYGETIPRAFPDYANVMEPYIYENIKLAFPNLDEDYQPVQDRINLLKASLREEYQQEMEGFATAVSGGERGFSENGKLSYEEALLTQMIPDALRGTNCNAMSLWGDKTVTGSKISTRILEWNLGSDRQMSSGHCVLHMKNGGKSITTISILGMLDIITAVNNDGVFAGILDVGSGNSYIYDGKTCYTYDLRYALETYDNARDAGNYMVENSSNYTWSHNIILTDKKNSYCVENCVDSSCGTALLRDCNTPLHEGLSTQNEGSLWAINSFLSKENEDNITNVPNNMIRYEKFNRWIKETDKFSLSDVKRILTSEDIEREMNNIYSSHLVHLIIVDYETETVHALFTGKDGTKNNPEFIDIGSYRQVR